VSDRSAKWVALRGRSAADMLMSPLSLLDVKGLAFLPSQASMTELSGQWSHGTQLDSWGQLAAVWGSFWIKSQCGSFENCLSIWHFIVACTILMVGTVLRVYSVSTLNSHFEVQYLGTGCINTMSTFHLPSNMVSCAGHIQPHILYLFLTHEGLLRDPTWSLFPQRDHMLFGIRKDGKNQGLCLDTFIGSLAPCAVQPIASPHRKAERSGSLPP